MDVLTKLLYMGRQYQAGANARGGDGSKHYLLEAVDEITALRAEVRGLREAVQSAYGVLWCVNNEPGTPHRYSPEKAAYEVRKALRDLLTNEQRGAGINAAIAALRAAPLLTGEPRPGGEG